jgi:tetratricopeptide (TPR) repeat protein
MSDDAGMGPLPYPHRATFLASTLIVPPALERARPYLARVVSLLLFDQLVRHRVLTLGDHDDERLVDEHGMLLDARHSQIEDSIDWFFRVSRRHEVLWLELPLDPHRPAPVVLRSRRPFGAIEEWPASAEVELSHQLSQCVMAWLQARRLHGVPAFERFTADDLRVVAERLAQADAVLAQGRTVAQLPASMLAPPERLAVPYLRVLSELARDGARALDEAILELDPTHPIARRNRYVAQLVGGGADRRAILPLAEEAPMFAKPHLSIWGEPFAGVRAHESMGVRHQGIAASLMPANPYACHNYSLQLAEDGRREESYRWADRATVAAPNFGPAHLDCVRRLRQVERPGQAFAEAQYRCREILDRAASGTLSGADWQAPHHAALLIAFAHLDVGRLAEAIELADDAMVRLPDDAATRDAFAWAHKRIAHWKTDAGLLARSYAWEGHHRADPGRVIAGLGRGRISDDDDAAMLIEALIATGRFEQAELAYWHCAGIDGHGVLGDGKARVAAARALILRGDLDEALDQLQLAQLRRSQSRLEADIERVLRLAATRPAAEWERVIERRLARGAVRLAQLAARDLADFVPGMDTPLVRRVLGERPRLTLDPLLTAELIGALPSVHSSSAAIVERLAWPEEDSLRAADALAQEWWTVLVPPARDRDAHAAGAVLALGVSLASYLVAASGPPTPIAGGYRHIATEALHLVRRARYQIDPAAIQALLRVLDAFGGAPDGLLDTWLSRVERALDLEAEHGAYLDGMLAGMPTVQRLLRGDERIGWELRLAHDLAADPSQYEPATHMFVRCARAVEGGSVPLAWSAAAAEAEAPLEAQLDVHWLAALANPSLSEPWLRLAESLFTAGHIDDGFAAACKAMTAAAARDRSDALAALSASWKRAGVPVPFDGDAAFSAGQAAIAAGRLDDGVRHLRWASAVEPGNPTRAHALAAALARQGRGLEAVRVFSAHERNEAPRVVGRLLLEAGHVTEAIGVLRYASRRFRTIEDWTTLALAASRGNADAVTVEAGRRAAALGATDPAVLVGLVTGLFRLGEFVECEQHARTLLAEAATRDHRLAGLHAMARALAGQGRHVDAHPYAKAAYELNPEGAIAAELRETLDCIVGQTEPAVMKSPEATMERQACDDLEAGKFEQLAPAITSPSWGVARVALAACEFRTDDESGIPVAPRALEAAVTMLGRTEGTLDPEATLARVRALRIRDNAFIQIDPPPPLGLRYTREEFERLYAERERRPHRPSAVGSFSR